MFVFQLNKNSTNQKPKTPTASNNDRGVVYFGHVPHGFYEKEMKHFFSQFGDVTNISIPKSRVMFLFIINYFVG